MTESSVSTPKIVVVHGYLQLMQAWSNGHLALIPVYRETRPCEWRQQVQWASGRPTLALLRDSNGRHHGPANWPLALRVIAWSEALFIWTSPPMDYAPVIEASAAFDTYALVETTPERATFWVECAAQSSPRPHVFVSAATPVASSYSKQ